jgi:hypothetical protein
MSNGVGFLPGMTWLAIAAKIDLSVMLKYFLAYCALATPCNV